MSTVPEPMPTGAAPAMPPTEPAAENEVKKRGPGRPPKRHRTPPLKHVGIVDRPANADHRMEFVYGDPIVFKSLFTYFKGLKVQNVYMRCSPTEIVFFARDSATACRVVARLPGADVHHFYCVDTFTVGFNRKFVEKTFSGIDKSFFKITMTIDVGDEEYLNIIFKDPEINKDCHSRIVISTFDADDGLFAAEHESTTAAAEAYPLRFTLPAQKLKKTINDAQSDQITFEKLDGDHPLKIVYDRANLAYVETYRDSKKIDLRAPTGRNGMFRLTARVANIKPLAIAMVSKFVQICCSPDRDMLLRSTDGALQLSTLVRRL